ncbi:MAG: pyridoxamine 5'-phosphate oxidase family protein [Rhodoferax sp.]
MDPQQPLDPMTVHESRLDRALRALLVQQRVAALGTLGEQGQPFVSMVPFAVWAESAALVIHVSLLAPHTRNLLGDPRVSVMVQQPEVAGEPVHALPRVSIDALARRLGPGSDDWLAARGVYLARFPEAQPMTELGDFSFVALQPTLARHVAGFGSARPLDADAMGQVLRLSAHPQ